MNKKLSTVAVVAVVAAAGFFALKPNSAAIAETAASDVETTAGENELPAYLADRVLGEADAAVTVMEYANFTCSHCGDFHRTVFDQLKTEYVDTGKVKFIHREVITDGPGVLAVSLARCLPENQYFGMAGMLYDDQQEWVYSQESLDGVKTELRKFANLAGLSADALNACFDDTAKQEEMLVHFRALADEDKIKGTPSIYVNGEYVADWKWDNLKEKIDAALD